MKTLVLILSIMSILLGGSGRKAVSEVVRPEVCCSGGEVPHSGEVIGHSSNRDFCITAPFGYSFTGYSGMNYVPVRNLDSGRRTSPKSRSTFRIVKSGKVIDNKNLYPLLALSFSQQPGTHSSQRFLYSICRLRL